MRKSGYTSFNPDMFIFGQNIYPEGSEFMMVAENDLVAFDFLRKLALESGAADAELVTTDKVVVEDRVVLKCKVGCTNYGKTLACPPYTPSAEQFRRIVGEYSYALFMKFKSGAEGDAEVAKYLSKADSDPSVPIDVKEKLKKFWSKWNEDKKKMLETVVGLEKAALSKGYPLAVGFVSGYCQLCEKCSLDPKTCAHRDLARISEEAVGVNVKSTAKNAGIEVSFPFEKSPESFALLLID